MAAKKAKAKKPNSLARFAPSKQFVLRWLAENPSISRRELCRRAGLSESTLTMAFSPNRAASDFKTDALQRLAAAMGVSIAALLGQPEASPVNLGDIAEQAARAAAFEAAGLALIDFDRLLPDPKNPAHRLETDIESLADDIARYGLLHNLAVAPHPERPGWFEIKSGHRRWAAIGRLCEESRWPEARPIPCRILAADEPADTFLSRLAANWQALPLSPLEEGQALHEATEIFGFSSNELAERLSRTPQFVNQRIALHTKLHSAAQAMLRDGEIGIEEARTLCAFEPAHQKLVIQALERGDADLVKGGEAFRARARQIVDLHRNAGGAPPTRATIHPEAERDETLRFDHQPSEARDYTPATGEQDRTTFEPPRAPDHSERDAGTQAFEAAAQAMQGEAGQQDETAGADEARRERNARIDAFEAELRAAMARHPAMAQRLLLLHVVNCVQVDSIGVSPLLRNHRASMPWPADTWDEEAAEENYHLSLNPSLQGFSAQNWANLLTLDAVDLDRITAACIAGLIELPHRETLPAHAFFYLQSLAGSLGVAWPEGLYAAAPAADDDDDSDDGEGDDEAAEDDASDQEAA